VLIACGGNSLSGLGWSGLQAVSVAAFTTFAIAK